MGILGGSGKNFEGYVENCEKFLDFYQNVRIRNESQSFQEIVRNILKNLPPFLFLRRTIVRVVWKHVP